MSGIRDEQVTFLKEVFPTSWTHISNAVTSDKLTHLLNYLGCLDTIDSESVPVTMQTPNL